MKKRQPMRKVQQPRRGLSCKSGADCVISRTVICSMQRACTHKVPGFNTDYAALQCVLPYCTHSISEHFSALHIPMPLALAICGHSNDMGRLANFPNWRETKGESCPAWCVLCAMYSRAGRRNLAKLPPVAELLQPWGSVSGRWHIAQVIYTPRFCNTIDSMYSLSDWIGPKQARYVVRGVWLL